MGKRFVVSFPDTELSIDGVWPDGGAPLDPTAEDVARVMEGSGGFYGVMREWNLLDRLYVDGVEVS